MLRAAIVAVALAAAAPATAATTLTAGLSGTVNTNQLFPEPGQQTISLTGAFSSYLASADLPQINAGDFSAYTFTVSGIATAFNALTNTATYSLTTGTINAYGALIQTLAPSTLTVTFTPDGSTGAIAGSLQSAGPTARPPGFPGTGDIDFTPANGAVISGLYTRTGPESDGDFTASIDFASAAAVPEPATWAMMIGGFGMVGGVLRAQRRKQVRVTYA